jgi:hypothetical protein
VDHADARRRVEDGSCKRKPREPSTSAWLFRIRLRVSLDGLMHATTQSDADDGERWDQIL